MSRPVRCGARTGAACTPRCKCGSSPGGARALGFLSPEIWQVTMVSIAPVSATSTPPAVERCTLTQPRYDSSSASSFPCATNMNRAFACVNWCLKDLTASRRNYEHKERLNFSFFLSCAVCCCVFINPSSVLCTRWQPWCNSSHILRHMSFVAATNGVFV